MTKLQEAPSLNLDALGAPALPPLQERGEWLGVPAPWTEQPAVTEEPLPVSEAHRQAYRSAAETHDEAWARRRDYLDRYQDAALLTPYLVEYEYVGEDGRLRIDKVNLPGCASLPPLEYWDLLEDNQAFFHQEFGLPAQFEVCRVEIDPDWDADQRCFPNQDRRQLLDLLAATAEVETDPIFEVAYRHRQGEDCRYGRTFLSSGGMTPQEFTTYLGEEARYDYIRDGLLPAGFMVMEVREAPEEELPTPGLYL